MHSLWSLLCSNTSPLIQQICCGINADHQIVSLGRHCPSTVLDLTEILTSTTSTFGIL